MCSDIFICLHSAHNLGNALKPTREGLDLRCLFYCLGSSDGELFLGERSPNPPLLRLWFEPVRKKASRRTYHHGMPETDSPLVAVGC